MKKIVNNNFNMKKVVDVVFVNLYYKKVFQIKSIGE